MTPGEIVERFRQGEAMGPLAETLGMSLEDVLGVISSERKRVRRRQRERDNYKRKREAPSLTTDPEVGWIPPEPARVPYPQERLLRAAVLSVAVQDARDGDVGAVRWIFSDTHGWAGFSCADICDVLGVEIEEVRKVVARARGRMFDPENLH